VVPVGFLPLKLQAMESRGDAEVAYEELNKFPLIDIQEAASRLGISVKTLYAWVHLRKVPYVKVGRLVRFDARDINTWIEKQKVPEMEY